MNTLFNVHDGISVVLVEKQIPISLKSKYNLQPSINSKVECIVHSYFKSRGITSAVVVPRRNKKPTTYLRNKKDSIKGVFDELENISFISKFATEKFKTFDKQDDVADAIRMIWRHLKLKQ